tara:strand:- start:461 stop:1003 length:543 start_codon:yes stop_codon:yes gene_type:complete
MRYAAALAVILAATPVTPVLGADKGAPPATLDDLLSLRAKAPLAGCYGELSMAGTFVAAGSRDAQAGVGGGCDRVVGNTIVGAGIRADFGDFKSGSLFAKAGFTVNPNAAVYLLGTYAVNDWKLKYAGQFNLGAGAELSIASLVPNTNLFVEGTTAVSKFGPLATKDDVVVRFGARIRIP